MAPMVITLGHSPDPDDAFMFYPLAQGLIDTGPYEFKHTLQDIETLNRRAAASDLDVTAISVHAYAHVHERYLLLPSGASVGEGYGPLLVSRDPVSPEDLEGRTVAIPGTMTTACLAFRLRYPDLSTVVVPFDQIPDAVLGGKADLGLLIHEGQLTYGDMGLHKVLDLGEWWQGETGLPLPLGVNAIRKGLGPGHIGPISRLVTESIRFALDHRDEALTHALDYGRGLDRGRADRFVGMYVNDFTLDLGDRGREAVRLLLSRGREAALLPQSVDLEFAE